MDAARRAQQEFDAEIVTVLRTSREYKETANPPLCPSVAVNGRLISRGSALSYEDLKAAILAASPEDRRPAS